MTTNTLAPRADLVTLPDRVSASVSAAVRDYGLLLDRHEAAPGLLLQAVIDEATAGLQPDQQDAAIPRIADGICAAWNEARPVIAKAYADKAAAALQHTAHDGKQTRDADAKKAADKAAAAAKKRCQRIAKALILPALAKFGRDLVWCDKAQAFKVCILQAKAPAVATVKAKAKGNADAALLQQQQAHGTRPDTLAQAIESADPSMLARALVQMVGPARAREMIDAVSAGDVADKAETRKARQQQAQGRA